jgi:hypothetical protein
MSIHRDEETVTNDLGGKQSAVNYRMDLLPAEALLSIAHTLKTGADKYGELNWRRIETNDHLNHALIHVMATLTADTNLDIREELTHAATRLMFALQIEIEKERDAEF